MKKKPKKPRAQTLRMTVSMVRAHTSWNDTQLVFEDYVGPDNQLRRCSVHIESPSAVAYLREKLDEIEAAWRAQLDAIKVRT